MSSVTHLTAPALESALVELQSTPREHGTLAMIVRRPAENEREELTEAELSVETGLVGDNWAQGRANPDCQLTLMNARAAQLVAQSRDRWALAGDQLYVEFDLSDEHLPTGTQVAIGDAAVVEVTAEPHTGCDKFISRFGLAAMKFVNSEIGRSLNLRGINTRVVTGGVIRRGDAVRRLAGQ